VALRVFSGDPKKCQTLQPRKRRTTTPLPCGIVANQQSPIGTSALTA